MKLEVGAAMTNPDDAIEHVVVRCGQWQREFDSIENIRLNLSELGSGSKTLEITVTTQNGLSDTTSLRLIVQ